MIFFVIFQTDVVITSLDDHNRIRKPTLRFSFRKISLKHFMKHKTLISEECAEDIEGVTHKSTPNQDIGQFFCIGHSAIF